MLRYFSLQLQQFFPVHAIKVNIKLQSVQYRKSRVNPPVIILFLKHEIYRPHYKKKRNQVVPAQRLLQIHYGKYGKYGKGDYFLDHFQLETVKPFHKPDPVSRHLEAIFEKSDRPAYNDHLP